MLEMHSSPFAGFIEISPPLSQEEWSYINSVITPWQIAEDGGRIVPSGSVYTDSPAEWLAGVIDTFIRLDPAIMKRPIEARIGVPNFAGHICNGHIQCRHHHNIVVENNRVGRELSWPSGKVEWLNQPEPAFEAMQDARDKRHPLPSFEEMLDPVKLFSGGLPLRGHKAGMIDPSPSLLDIWNKANKIDGWPGGKDVEEVAREDVERLKADWEADPIWDLEGTEGFEAFHDELKTFSDVKKAEWAAIREKQEQERITKIQEKAAELECSFGVAQYVTCLEGRIKHLEKQVGVLLEHSDAAYREIKGV